MREDNLEVVGREMCEILLAHVAGLRVTEGRMLRAVAAFSASACSAKPWGAECRASGAALCPICEIELRHHPSRGEGAVMDCEGRQWKL